MVKNRIKRFAAAGIAAVLMGSLAACGAPADTPIEYSLDNTYHNAKVLKLNGSSAQLDGVNLEEFDYVWHADPSQVHDEVKDCPAEYFTGTKPETDAAAYIAHDIYYYPSLDPSGFTKVSYDGEQEWVYYYNDGENDKYIFSTLPVEGEEVPSDMMHTEEEAYNNPVIHITQPGTYVLEGRWNGQIWVDLGDKDETFTDENAKVTLVLNGADITCTAAPAVVFYSAYEADNGWEDADQHSSTVNTENAGAVVVAADDTVNNISGQNIFRMLKTKYKSEDDNGAVPVQKKARKIDGALYSYVSMNMEGGEKDNGVLNITSGFEGLNSELHLTVNGGNITIYADNDGINTNEDDVSVVTVNGGSLQIYAGLGAEGDGIDSNGYIVINGGKVVSVANPRSDNGLDSSCGTEINGGEVVALGSNMGGSSYTVYLNGELQYGSSITSDFGGHGPRPDFGGEMPDFKGERPEFNNERPDFGGERPNGFGPNSWNENGEPIQK